MAAAESIRIFQEVIRDSVSEMSEAMRDMFRREFEKLDTDRSGVVSKRELAAHPVAAQMQPAALDNLMRLLDVDDNNQLSFEECCALFRIAIPFNICNSCSTSMKDHLFLTCVHCALNEDDTFDLCLDCFAAGRFTHKHPLFLPQHFIKIMDKGKKKKSTESFVDFVRNLKAGYDVGQIASSLCSMQ